MAELKEYGAVKDLAVLSQEKYLVTYRKMQAAIATCHAVDECMHVNDHAIRLAAYFEKARDDQAVRMFHEIKLRSWKKVGEIVIAAVDFSGAETKSAQLKCVRTQLENNPTVRGLSDHQLRSAMMLAVIPEENFEKFLEAAAGSVVKLIDFADPDRIEARRKHAENQAKWAAEWEESREARETAEAEENQRRREERQRIDRLVTIDDAAIKEVGLTLLELRKKDLKRVILLLQPDLHEALRQAHFDRRLTMQEILRKGLRLWLSANGYKVEL